ncbi:hypothetical protein XJ18_17640 [Bacillus pumilus]|nr:hypothetical protein XJ18_17640 [Bacillus pumilus]
MTKYTSGADALNALNATNEGGGGGNSAEFASFKTGTVYKVRVMSAFDLIRFFSYGIYKKVNSFSAANPSTLNKNGFPESNLTSWDRAWKYYQDQKKAAADRGDAKAEEAAKQEAAKYRVKERYALGFINLETGQPIIVDLSKTQATTVHAVIKKQEKKLGRIAFELEKSGSGTNTVVSLTPLIDMEEDLTEAERKHFADQDGKEFDMSLFDGLIYEADEKEMIENLVAAGFNLALIGESLDGGAEDVELPAGENFEF